MSRNHESLNLIAVLDVLRDAYDLAKEAHQPALQERLMGARRQLLLALHQNLDLHNEVAELQEQLTQLRARDARAAANDDTPLFAGATARIS